MLTMNIVILDDYQDVVRKLNCAEKLKGWNTKVYNNTVKGMGQDLKKAGEKMEGAAQK